jgi:hypothetical protein
LFAGLVTGVAPRLAFQDASFHAFNGCEGCFGWLGIGTIRRGGGFGFGFSFAGFVAGWA